ncbi:MAG: hypothetical protein JEZ06_23220 [Anaerolineaceae bacterium]|nr:hypothetical protein [Anaerolineaceae bacterium]
MDSQVFLGIAIASGDRPFTALVIDRNLCIHSLHQINLNELLAFISKFDQVLLGINAPSGLNQGLLDNNAPLPGMFMGPGRPRKFNMRQAEFDLIKLDLPARETPSNMRNCPRWMRLGFKLYACLRDMGFSHYDGGQAAKQFFEVKGETGFFGLNKHELYLSRSLEGRIQRQLILYREGLRIKNPMVFFEEVTPFRLLASTLPVDLIYEEVELNAMLAAYTALLIETQEERVRKFGDEEEGIVYVPFCKTD